jgi:L-proline amide hydrolase
MLQSRYIYVVLTNPAGGTHHCVLSNAALARPSRPIILYDQVGCGTSTHLRSVDPSFWSTAHFLAELTNLLTHIGLQSRTYDLLGHSWGGMLAALHASTQPPGLRKLIVANAPPDFPSWGRAAKEKILPLLSKGAQEAIEYGERTANEGGRESEKYQAAIEEFFDECGYRKDVNEDISEGYKRDMGAAIEAIMDDDTVPIAT